MRHKPNLPRLRPSSFPRVTEADLAELLRQLLPVAEAGVRALKTDEAAMIFRAAEVHLDMWCRQERGRHEQLRGPLPPIANLSGAGVAPPDPVKEMMGKITANMERRARKKRGKPKV
jgi:hypothetical protein